ncbi:MAG TPA: DUF4332 domain-containing protein [Candidatus Thermoplasmatota archaeon]|nr:DUF4332 domain-containing protein [Candidatus Thermoplasmatota archaeon]
MGLLRHGVPADGHTMEMAILIKRHGALHLPMHGGGRPGDQAQRDAAHEPHKGFPSGPAQDALRARVRKDRRRFPRVLRTLLWTAFGMGLFTGALIAFLAVVDPRTLGIMLQVMGLSFAIGREGAILHAYTQGPSLGATWMVVTSVLDDLITLALALPLFWLGIERLRGAPFIGGIVLSLEKTAVEKRAFLRRWGLYGLVAFVWVPGVGAGVTLAAAIGLVSKIPLRSLILALALGSAAVNTFWAVGLYYTESLIPREGPWSYIPLAFIVVLVLFAVVFGLLQRRKRHLFPIVKVQILGDEHIERLLEVGITDGIDLLYANRTILAAKLGIKPASLGRLRSVAELSMLRTVSPRHAEMLTEVGVTSIRELSVAPPEMVAAAIHELELLHVIQPSPGEVEDFTGLCKQWTKDARIFFAESDS